MPSAPKYPCPYLTRDEISLYLVPLYRDGWVVGSSEFLKDKRLPRDEDSASPELTKAFLFAPEHRDARLEFAQSVGQLQTTEKHHCTVLVDDHSVDPDAHPLGAASEL
ncbi:hypothetical protein EVJ58_g10600 [Rhodofomes roseus]|uniref:Uncharacterized protein n=1 Tax=Rhodofomes roseus TaxID=34475 RepID=A0A4Y9XPU1_9APHY|nr:hypothetical protein EVJ58_g10600 [Rhodofomes roseus]